MIRMRHQVLINRGLFGLLGTAVAVAVAAPFSGWLERSSQVLPMPVPQVAVPELASTPRPQFPIRNPFDPDGKTWLVVEVGAIKPAPVTVAPPQDQAKGTVRLPGLSGLLTDHGFVKVGQDWQGDNLKEVSGKGYVLSAPTGERTIAINPARDSRVQSILASQQGKPKPWSDKK